MFLNQQTSSLKGRDMQTIEIDIVNGPSREDVRDSLGSKPNHRLSVSFRMDLNQETADEVAGHLPSFPTDQQQLDAEALINGMVWEDGTGECFSLSGYLMSVMYEDERGKESIQVGRLFKAHYNTNERRGLLELSV